MAKSPDGQKSGWQDDQMSGWPDVPMVRSLNGQMTRCLDGQMTRCPDCQMTVWPDDQMSVWPDNQRVRRQDIQVDDYLYGLISIYYKYISRNIGVASATTATPQQPPWTNQCSVQITFSKFSIKALMCGKKGLCNFENISQISVNRLL